MNSDCYAILGVSPSAEDVVIRAAYLALMRHYHPDRNGSADAAERARAIAQAYKMIGDPVSRAEYDARRTAHPFGILGFASEKETPARPRRTIPIVGSMAALALALVMAITVAPLVQRQPPAAPGAKPVLPIAASVETPAHVDVPEAMPLPPVEANLRQVAEPEPPEPDESPKPEPARASAEPTPRVDKPPPRSRPDRIKSATSVSRLPTPRAAPSGDAARLAVIERHSSLFFSQSVAHADAAKKLDLQQARQRFLAARSGCRSDSCLTDANLGHMRDVARIMEARGSLAL